MTRLLIVASALVLAGCARDKEYESGGTVDSAADTTARLSIPDIDIGTKVDTVNVPTLGTRKDTIIVDRPVVTGRKPVEVKRPTVDVNKRP